MDLDINSTYTKGLETLGLSHEEGAFLYDCKSYDSLLDPQLKFFLEQGHELGATAILFSLQLNNYKPQVYIFDYTLTPFEENKLTSVHKKIWTSGIVPITCVLYSTEIKILNTRTHISNEKPVYLLESLSYLDQANKVFNSKFASIVKDGTIWSNVKFEKDFSFNNSSYEILIKWIREVRQYLTSSYEALEDTLINKVIIQSILIKYLEEIKDSTGKGLFGNKYFPQFSKGNQFTDILRKRGAFIQLVNQLHHDFSGNLFEWNDVEKEQLSNLEFSLLANALDSNIDTSGQLSLFKLYDFRYIPIELISRLYEEFLAGTIDTSSKDSVNTQKENKLKEGIYYTPSHLAQLLIDEAMPLNSYKDVELKNFRVLDPACGSGIFLVLAFKRLVQWWRLQNNFQSPKTKDLYKIMGLVYGVDKEIQATQLAAFSLCLALCDELDPLKIITELKFPDLTKKNILNCDFFIKDNYELEYDVKYQSKMDEFDLLDKIRFSLVIGNPPFDRGALKSYHDYATINGVKINIPQNQIAIKFLLNSLNNLGENGLQCLLIKASSLLYNSTSEELRNFLFKNFDVVQIFDFSALARNKSLWDNGADVACVAIFIRNEKPNNNKNILHLTFRRTLSTKRRLQFEVDEYDFHYVTRNDAINKKHIWKCNMLGGKRLHNIIERYSIEPTLNDFLKVNNFIAGEGFIFGTNGKLADSELYEFPTLPTKAITEEGIDYSKLEVLAKENTFKKVGKIELFKAPNILIWENIGQVSLPVFYNEISFTFKDKVISIKSLTDSSKTKHVYDVITKNNDFYRFHIIATSSQLLINLNTAVLKKDYMDLPFPEVPIKLTETDNLLIKDTTLTMMDFWLHGENSKSLSPISQKSLKTHMEIYGRQFSEVLNSVYATTNRFRLSDVISFNNNDTLAAIFKYDNLKEEFHIDLLEKKILLENLIKSSINSKLTARRIIRIYDINTIILIKPNQIRYWNTIIALRDADKSFADLSNSGF